ncbi:hypothetical protein Y032_0053g2284 [Ancylostoma ceylanicum]|nr:hypothetical protein Y032_0053g2284 [Ancylostoma ceylanicum]
MFIVAFAVAVLVVLSGILVCSTGPQRLFGRGSLRVTRKNAEAEEVEEKEEQPIMSNSSYLNNQLNDEPQELEKFAAGPKWSYDAIDCVDQKAPSAQKEQPQKGMDSCVKKEGALPPFSEAKMTDKTPTSAVGYSFR